MIEPNSVSYEFMSKTQLLVVTFFSVPSQSPIVIKYESKIIKITKLAFMSKCMGKLQLLAKMYFKIAHSGPNINVPIFFYIIYIVSDTVLPKS